MTYGVPPNPEVEKARLKNEVRSNVEDTPGMQAARQAQGVKADAQWQARQAMGDMKQAGSFLDRLTGWFKRK